MSKLYPFPSCRCRTASMDSGLRRNDGRESGSALIYIFIGVALFGALMFMFSRGGSQGTTALSDQQAKIVATEIIDYSRTVETAVNKLLMKGCSESEISFENTVVAGYTNPNSPVNYSCHVFRPEGGKIVWQSPPPSIPTPDNNYVFSLTAFSGIGTTGTIAGLDIAIALRMIPTKVCQQINILSKTKKNPARVADSYDIPIEDDNPNFTYGAITSPTKFFIGTINYARNIGNSESMLAPNTSRCIKDDTNPEYDFLYILHGR